MMTAEINRQKCKFEEMIARRAHESAVLAFDKDLVTELKPHHQSLMNIWNDVKAVQEKILAEVKRGTSSVITKNRLLIASKI